jgi:hypothetical protein
MHFFSIAQCFGYLAFVLGVTAFSQKNDRWLKFLIASESMVYAVHFLLLGNSVASASALTSGIRSFLAMKTRSVYLAALIIAVNVGFGFTLAKSSAGWLPVLASCLATIAIFRMQGIPMRLVLLVSTLLWLANNIVSGSIGGTLLELVIATVNIATMLRLLRTPACTGSAS